MRNRNFYRGDYKQYREHHYKNRVFFGIALAIIGIVLMLRTMGLIPYFSFEYSWPVILIVVGTLIGIKKGFRNNAWCIFIIVGIANLTPQFMIMGKPSTHYIWPAVIIIIGIEITQRPRRDPACAPEYLK